MAVNKKLLQFSLFFPLKLCLGNPSSLRLESKYFFDGPGNHAFALSQSASISARLAVSRLFPLESSSFSINLKRRRNFRLVFFSAVSGSTSRRRARFTTTKSKIGRASCRERE